MNAPVQIVIGTMIAAALLPGVCGKGGNFQPGVL